MNISCSICAELFRNQNATDLQVTPCGHVFHNICLSQWLKRYFYFDVMILNLMENELNFIRLKYKLQEKYLPRMP